MFQPVTSPDKCRVRTNRRHSRKGNTKMKIKATKNSEKLDAAIKAVEKKATARCQSSYTVAEYCEDTERKLSKLGLSKKAMIGAQIEICEMIGCSAYGRRAYGASSTVVTCERFPSGWFVFFIDRISIAPSDNRATVRIILSDNQKKIVADKFLKDNDI